MKAVAYQSANPVTHSAALLDISLPEPVATGHDLLVEVKAISVNPVDYKIRASQNAPDGAWKVLGWDAAGVVKAVGSNVTLFKPGDHVWYAGDIRRPGSNAELQLVDERIVGHMPTTIGFAEAAALPLTTITAWELLFDRLGVPPQKQATTDSLLIIGAAGGVGSVLTQLARQLTNLTVIGSASRPETQDWIIELGAHHFINHNRSFVDELKAIDRQGVSMVASLNNTERNFSQIADSLAPQGKLAMIDDPSGSLDIMKLKSKSISLHWELMFTRSLFQTEDMIAQHRILNEAAGLVDAGILRSTMTQHFGLINAENLKRAHQLLESGQSVGKVVLEGFQ